MHTTASFEHYIINRILDKTHRITMIDSNNHPQYDLRLMSFVGAAHHMDTPSSFCDLCRGLRFDDSSHGGFAAQEQISERA